MGEQRPTRTVLGYYHKVMLAARKHLDPETHLDNLFNPLARFYPLEVTPLQYLATEWENTHYLLLLLLLVLVGLVEA